MSFCLILFQCLSSQLVLKIVGWNIPFSSPFLTMLSLTWVNLTKWHILIYTTHYVHLLYILWCLSNITFGCLCGALTLKLMSGFKNLSFLIANFKNVFKTKISCLLALLLFSWDFSTFAKNVISFLGRNWQWNSKIQMFINYILFLWNKSVLKFKIMKFTLQMIYNKFCRVVLMLESGIKKFFFIKLFCWLIFWKIQYGSLFLLQGLNCMHKSVAE